MVFFGKDTLKIIDKNINEITTCSIDISTESLDTSNKMSGIWKATLSGTRSWSVSCEALYTRNSGVTSFDDLLEAQLSGSSVKIVFAVSNETTYEFATGLYSGEVRITSLSLKADNNQIATCSITLEGTGALTKVA